MSTTEKLARHGVTAAEAEERFGNANSRRRVGEMYLMPDHGCGRLTFLVYEQKSAASFACSRRRHDRQRKADLPPSGKRYDVRLETLINKDWGHLGEPS
jgi:hypothetical protein